MFSFRLVVCDAETRNWGPRRLYPSLTRKHNAPENRPANSLESHHASDHRSSIRPDGAEIRSGNLGSANGPDPGLRTQTTMSDPRLPPEILDYIVDFLHRKPHRLKRCSLVAKSWVSRTRKHLFKKIEIASLTDLEAWWKAFPDPDSSPGCHVRCLLFNSVGCISSVVAGGCSLVRPFSNVVRLEMWSGKGILHDRFFSHLLTGSRIHVGFETPGLTPSQFTELICSLPLLEDLDIAVTAINKGDDDCPVFQPLSSPPLTGTLSLSLAEGMEHVTCGLLNLPNGVHFRKFLFTWRLEEDFQWITALVEGCSNTLKYIEFDRDG